METSTLRVWREQDHCMLEVIHLDQPGGDGRVLAGGRIPLPLPELAPGAGDAIDVLPALLTAHRPDLPEQVTPQAAAEYLYRLLADHGLGPWLEQESGDGVGDRSVLLHVEDEDLRRLPWEMITQPGTMWAPFVDARSTWTRVAASLDDLGAVAPPVRVLFVAGDYPGEAQDGLPDGSQLGADDELDVVIRALCPKPADFHVEYLIAPTRTVFDEVYSDLKPHVLHVVAHGTEFRGQTVLSFRDGLDGAWAMTPSQVTNGLATCPRLVVLNACRTGHRHSNRAAWSFTDLFLRRGAAAVVTMQGDVPTQAGVDFTEAFYGRIAEHEPIDVAAGSGRVAVFRQNDAPEVWAIPTLTLRRAPGTVLATPRPRPAPVRLNAVVPEAIACVDRARERRRVWTTSAPEGVVHHPRLIRVTGGDHTGKSAVVKGALPACHARGCDIAYVDFGPSRRLGWFAAVRRVHDDLLDWLPEYDAELARFAHTAESNRTGLGQADDPAPVRTFGEDLTFENEADLGAHRKEVIFSELRRVVETCAGEGTLLLVLDHLYRGLSDEARDDYILPRLVQPLLDDSRSKVVVALVVPRNHEVALTLPIDAPDPVDVHEFDASAAVLIREYLARQGLGRGLTTEQKDLTRLVAAQKASWEPMALKKAFEYMAEAVAQ